MLQPCKTAMDNLNWFNCASRFWYYFDSPTGFTAFAGFFLKSWVPFKNVGETNLGKKSVFHIFDKEHYISFNDQRFRDIAQYIQRWTDIFNFVSSLRSFNNPSPCQQNFLNLIFISIMELLQLPESDPFSVESSLPLNPKMF